MEKTLQNRLQSRQEHVSKVKSERSNLKTEKVKMIKSKYMEISDRVEKETLMDIYDIQVKKRKIAECVK